jgi:GT2 family glycosyltransferase
LLGALDAQDLDEPFDVVIVDDGSTDETVEVLERLGASARVPLVTLRAHGPVGPAAARNIGWRHTSARLVAFTDDDCVPQPSWLRGLVAGLDAADIAQGATVPDPEHEAQRGPFSHIIGVTEATGYYETCNIGYRRTVLEGVGGFDERFRHPYGEDTDLAWRALEQGATALFVPTAVVFHDIAAQGYLDHLRGMRRREGLVRVLHEHPHLRRRLGLGYFFRRSHPPALATLAAVLAVAVGWRTLLGLACVVTAGAWYAHACRWSTAKPARRAAWLVVVPLRFVADVYEIGVLARASIKHRILLL